tara:strand:- start:443 stop:610 length:168 start_codon:yes stop_codon:yes gene_type:complete
LEGIGKNLNQRSDKRNRRTLQNETQLYRRDKIMTEVIKIISPELEVGKRKSKEDK